VGLLFRSKESSVHSAAFLLLRFRLDFSATQSDGWRSRAFKIASEISVRGFRMLLQIRLYERTHWHYLELIEMGIVQRGTNQLVAQAASAPWFWDLSMNQGDAVLRTMVLQNGALISQRDFKLAFRFVMRYGTAVHETLLLRFFLQILRDCRPAATISSDAGFAPRAAAMPAA